MIPQDSAERRRAVENVWKAAESSEHQGLAQVSLQNRPQHSATIGNAEGAGQDTNEDSHEHKKGVVAARHFKLPAWAQAYLGGCISCH